eukprot:251723-Amphidinium_carterae.1
MGFLGRRLRKQPNQTSKPEALQDVCFLVAFGGAWFVGHARIGCCVVGSNASNVFDPCKCALLRAKGASCSGGNVRENWEVWGLSHES